MIKTSFQPWSMKSHLHLNNSSQHNETAIESQLKITIFLRSPTNHNLSLKITLKRTYWQTSRVSRKVLINHNNNNNHKLSQIDMNNMKMISRRRYPKFRTNLLTRVKINSWNHTVSDSFHQDRWRVIKKKLMTWNEKYRNWRIRSRYTKKSRSIINKSIRPRRVRNVKHSMTYKTNMKRTCGITSTVWMSLALTNYKNWPIRSKISSLNSVTHQEM